MTAILPKLILLLLLHSLIRGRFSDLYFVRFLAFETSAISLWFSRLLTDGGVGHMLVFVSGGSQLAQISKLNVVLGTYGTR